MVFTHATRVRVPDGEFCLARGEKKKKKKKKIAPAGNQTRVSSVAGMYIITILPARSALSVPRLELGTSRVLGERHDQLDHTDRKSGVSGFRSQYLVLAKDARFRLRQYPDAARRAAPAPALPADQKDRAKKIWSIRVSIPVPRPCEGRTLPIAPIPRRCLGARAARFLCTPGWQKINSVTGNRTPGICVTGRDVTNYTMTDGRASSEDRTRDLALTKRMLCQLSYRGVARSGCVRALRFFGLCVHHRPFESPAPAQECCVHSTRVVFNPSKVKIRVRVPMDAFGGGNPPPFPCRYSLGAGPRLVAPIAWVRIPVAAFFGSAVAGFPAGASPRCVESVVRSYHDESTASHPNCEVKHRWARSVLQLGTMRESRVLYGPFSFCFREDFFFFEKIKSESHYARRDSNAGFPACEAGVITN